MTRWLPQPGNLSSEKDAGQKEKVNSVSCSGYSFSVLILKTTPHPLLTFVQTFHTSPSVCPHSPLSFLASRNTAPMDAARTRTERSNASTTIQVQELGNKPSAKQDISLRVPGPCVLLGTLSGRVQFPSPGPFPGNPEESGTLKRLLLPCDSRGMETQRIYFKNCKKF